MDILDQNFKKYYYNYLEFNKLNNRFYPKTEDFTVNDFKYPIIISFYANNIIGAISNKLYESIKYILKEDMDRIELENCLINFFSKSNEDIVINRMRRMSKVKETNLSVADVICINEINKHLFYNSFTQHNDVKYKQVKWEKLLKNTYINGIVRDDKIVSLGYVSNKNIYGANIVIQTLDDYRGKGYGKMIVEKISRDLLKDGIMPIYWVNENNPASLRLAESIGFKTMALEIVAKYN